MLNIFITIMDKDVNFANNFFTNVLTTPKNRNECNLPDFRNNLMKALDVCQTIRQKENYIRENLSTMSDQCFKEHVENITTLQYRLNLSMFMLNDPANIESLKLKLAKRTKKRLRMKRLRNTQKLQKSTQMNTNEEKKKEFEKKLASIEAETKEMKRIENVNKEANAKLKDVNKRKLDARKNISLIDALYKLRSAREKSASGRGDNVSVADSKIFASSIEKLKLLWDNALIKYEAEEKVIKDMLETKVVKPEIDGNLSIVKDWKCIMFGEDFMPQKNFGGNLERFLLVRKIWDQYVCFENEGSKIPLGWLTPPVPSEGWKNYINRIT